MSSIDSSKPLASDSIFSSVERERLKVLAGAIVPASVELQLPGADDPLVFADILQSARDVEAPVRTGLAFADAEVSDWSDVAGLTQTLEGRAELAPFVSLVMQCYYRDDRVMQSLGMEARAPFPIGYEVPEGDWSMLEPVQRRGKIWRDA